MIKVFYRVVFAGLLWAVLAAPVPVSAAQNSHVQQMSTAAVKPTPDKPEKTVDRVTQVSVQAEGTDSIGAKLAMQIKDRFNRSSLFALTSEEKDGPKLQLLLMTSPEFPSRPAVGSVYSVCWVYSQGKGYLGYILARDLGTVNHEDMETLADKLVERTDGVAAKYGNLWK